LVPSRHKPPRQDQLATVERIAVDLIAFAFLIDAAIHVFTSGFDPKVVLGVSLALTLVESQSLRS
jgi:hypothetical protein